MRKFSHAYRSPRACGAWESAIFYRAKYRQYRQRLAVALAQRAHVSLVSVRERGAAAAFLARAAAQIGPGEAGVRFQGERLPNGHGITQFSDGTCFPLCS